MSAADAGEHLVVTGSSGAIGGALAHAPAALLAVDLVTPVALMHAAVADMVRARRGFVVNVTSMAGKVTLPGCAFYGAAKAGLSMASEIARRELGGAGVRVGPLGVAGPFALAFGPTAQ